MSKNISITNPLLLALRQPVQRVTTVCYRPQRRYERCSLFVRIARVIALIRIALPVDRVAARIGTIQGTVCAAHLHPRRRSLLLRIRRDIAQLVVFVIILRPRNIVNMTRKTDRKYSLSALLNHLKL